MEHSIQHDDLPLATEKQYVRNIAKLKSQREQIRQVQGQQESLAQMEAEAKKIKAVIDEVRHTALTCCCCTQLVCVHASPSSPPCMHDDSSCCWRHGQDGEGGD
jgi:hypothetical protein